MKNFLFCSLLLLFFSCSENDVDLDDENYKFDGEGGIKCNVNGIELKPTLRISPGPSSKEIDFEFYNGQEYMSLYFYNNTQDANGKSQSVKIKIFGINPSQNLKGRKYQLQNEENNQNFGQFNFSLHEYATNDNNSGELEIIYHNEENRILAGKFWFDAIDKKGEIVKIRKGEFDMKY